jgi:predicted NBD/HSP70 family sugar kinase
MIAAGLDIGGTKIECQVFDAAWTPIARQRCATPDTYPELVSAIADQIAWADAQSGTPLPVGIGAAGVLHPQTDLIIAANLAANNMPMPRDIRAAIGRPISYLNDADAFTMSEAVFGAGRAHRTVAAVILGTGLGGGVCIDKRLAGGPSGLAGEFGHIAAPAHVIANYDLPILPCGCGRDGCFESYLSGPGLQKIAQIIAGLDLTPTNIAQRRTGDMHRVWTAWCAIAAELIQTLTLTIDPDVIVLGGGLSQIDGLANELMHAAQTIQIGMFTHPPVVCAEGGDASGARGAAYAAWQAQTNE